jgi:hypothetical protein
MPLLRPHGPSKPIKWFKATSPLILPIVRHTGALRSFLDEKAVRSRLLMRQVGKGCLSSEMLPVDPNVTAVLSDGNNRAARKALQFKVLAGECYHVTVVTGLFG